MKMSLRVRLLGTIVGAILLCFVISIVAARLTLQRDLRAQGQAQVTNGASAFGGYWDSRKDQIRLLVAQDAVADALRKGLEAKNGKALADQLANVARTSGLSFLTIVDTNGRVIARANGPNGGTLASNPYVKRALTGETVSTAAVLPASDLAGEGLAPQTTSDIKDADGKTVSHLDQGLSLVSAAPMSDKNERTIGAIYGGVLMNHYYDIVDQSTHALGGSSALLEGDAIVASTILAPDGTRIVDQAIPGLESVANGTPFDGGQTIGGTEYMVHVDPILSDQNKTVGARWYGTPMQAINDIINHTTESLALWGLLAAIIALALAIPVVQRISNTIGQRSKQVSDAAKELGVAIIGSEVSGDHVSATKAAVEKSGAVIDDLAKSGDPTGKVAQLKSLNEELSGDMFVIDTLSQEMSGRMTQAVARVHELSDVAGALDKLVTGEAN
jgi:hypothetical protein